MTNTRTPIPEKELRSGNSIPALGLGTWQLTEDTKHKVTMALQEGYRLIDTSSDYGTHQGIGAAVEDSDLERQDLFIQTKVEEDDSAYEACQQYLDEIQLEYADMLIIHRPPEEGAGIKLWEGLIKARENGFAVDIGVSNYTQSQIETLIDATGEVPAVNQIEWSPFGFSQDMLEFCQEHEITIQAYSPLTRAKRLDNDLLDSIADAHDKEPVQVLIRWDIQRGVIPIPKASSESHLEENIDVFDFELSDKQMKQLDELNEHYSSLGGLPYVSS